MNRIVYHASAIGLMVAICGCAVVPPLSPIERKQKQEKDFGSRVIKLPLSEVIARYAPPSFQFDPAADVNYATPILFDTSLPWSMAFERALADARIDPVALRTPAQSIQMEGTAQQNPQVSLSAVGVPGKAVNDGQEKAPAMTALGAAETSPALSQPQVTLKSLEPLIASCSKEPAASNEPVQVWEARTGLSCATP
jgi:hypothetical protein